MKALLRLVGWISDLRVAIVLLLAIIAAIVLTMRQRPNLKAQDISRQVSVKAADRIRIVKMDAEVE